jgi:hypothetical protein
MMSYYIYGCMLVMWWLCVQAHFFLWRCFWQVEFCQTTELINHLLNSTHTRQEYNYHVNSIQIFRISDVLRVYFYIRAISHIDENSFKACILQEYYCVWQALVNMEWTCEYHKTQGICWLTEQVLAYYKGFRSEELVSYLGHYILW